MSIVGPLGKLDSILSHVLIMHRILTMGIRKVKFIVANGSISTLALYVPNQEKHIHYFSTIQDWLCLKIC